MTEKDRFRVIVNGTEIQRVVGLCVIVPPEPQIVSILDPTPKPIPVRLDHVYQIEHAAIDSKGDAISCDGLIMTNTTYALVSETEILK